MDIEIGNYRNGLSPRYQNLSLVASNGTVVGGQGTGKNAKQFLM